MILALPMNNFFTHINNLLDLRESLPGIQEYLEDAELKAEQLFESFLNVSGMGPLIINLLVVAVVPAIGEELLFRGVLQDLFIRWSKNIFLGVLITSLVFALLHFQFLSVLPRFVLGMILGYIFVWTRSLWMPVLAHFINNALAVVYYHLLYKGTIERGIENVGKPDHDPVYAILSVVIIGILLFVIRRIMKDKINPSQSVQLSED
jgi:membrane protease YdiL (CAAX protease family)